MRNRCFCQFNCTEFDINTCEIASRPGGPYDKLAPRIINTTCDQLYVKPNSLHPILVPMPYCTGLVQLVSYGTKDLSCIERDKCPGDRRRRRRRRRG